MKKFAILLFVSLAINIFAQEDGLNTQNRDNQTLGCYLSFDKKISKLHNEYITYSGLSFGLMKNHRYTIGIAGYDLSGKNTFNYTDNHANVYNFKNEVSYGGLFFEYTFFNEFPVHISTPLLIGSGKATIKENVLLNQYEFENARNREDDYWATVEVSRFVVFEPGLATEVDLLEWMRLGFGVSYRYIFGNSLKSVPDADNDLSGFSFDITFKLGCF